jgi:hypothetical protein
MSTENPHDKSAVMSSSTAAEIDNLKRFLDERRPDRPAGRSTARRHIALARSYLGVETSQEELPAWARRTVDVDVQGELL